jgi:acetoin utilization deacetylase AcuC-like enzyme
VTSSLTVYWDDRVLLNDTGWAFVEVPTSPLLEVQEKHVENADRVINMRSVLQRGSLSDEIAWGDGRLATEDELSMAHPADYIASVKSFIAGGGGYLESNTVMSADAWESLLAAAGTAIEALDGVLSDATPMAYALIRPPGHHAQPRQAEGYGVFNHAALLAERALASGMRRVAIIDWDTHHGNGTQEFFYDRSDVLYFSYHMRHGSWSVTHPQTGSAAEIGVGEGMGYNVNIELPLGTGDAGYAKATREVVGPILRQYQPELLILSSGQDASAYDPNGRQNLTMRGFRKLGSLMRSYADELTGGRLVAVQEGGYHVSYSAYCLHATLEGLLGLEPRLEDPVGYLPDSPRHADQSIDFVQTYLAHFWEF